MVPSRLFDETAEGFRGDNHIYQDECVTIRATALFDVARALLDGVRLAHGVFEWRGRTGVAHFTGAIARQV